MVSFIKKKIKTEKTVGETLKSARIASSVLLDEAARAINISKDYLLWLEEEEFEKLPGDVYTKNFIKAYANFLKLDPQSLISLFKKERAVYGSTDPRKDNLKEPVKFIPRFHFVSVPKILRNAIVLCVVFIFLIYLGVKVDATISPPQLEVTEPSSDVLIGVKYIDVKGHTEPGARVLINGQNLFLNADGSFSEKINLNDGINEIKIIARKDHSRENVINRRVVVRESSN